MDNKDKVTEDVQQVRVTLDGREVTLSELKEQQANATPGTRIVEVSAGVYKTLARMQG